MLLPVPSDSSSHLFPYQRWGLQVPRFLVKNFGKGDSDTWNFSFLLVAISAAFPSPVHCSCFPQCSGFEVKSRGAVLLLSSFSGCFPCENSLEHLFFLLSPRPLVENDHHILPCCGPPPKLRPLTAVCSPAGLQSASKAKRRHFRRRLSQSSTQQSRNHRQLRTRWDLGRHTQDTCPFCAVLPASAAVLSQELRAVR